MITATPKVTLLILTLNEIDSIKVILPQITVEKFHQVIVVDGGSKDGTIEWCRRRGFDVYVQKRRGIRYAYWEVWPLIDGEFVISMSPDGNCDVGKLNTFFQMLPSSDLVIGSRYLGGNKSEDDDFITSFGNRIFNLVARKFFKSDLTDVMVIYRGFRKSLPEELDLFNSKRYETIERCFFTTISWEPLMSVRALKQGKKVSEFLAGEPKRIAGERKLQIVRWGLAYLSQFIYEKISR
jgi:glycosyltransferase involved in cell wall biosynthesis